MKYTNVEKLKFNTDIRSSIQQRCGIILVAEGVKPACDIALHGIYSHIGVSEQEFNKAIDYFRHTPYRNGLSIPRAIEEEFLRGKRFSMGNLCGTIGEGPSVYGSELKSLEDVLKNLGLKYKIGRSQYNPQGLERVNDSGKLIRIPQLCVPIIVARKKSVLKQLVAATKDSDSNPESQRVYGLGMGYPVTAVDAWIISKAVSGKEIPSVVDYEFFKFFRFSPDKWEEEIKTVIEWGKTIERVSPIMFEKARAWMDLLERI